MKSWTEIWTEIAVAFDTPRKRRNKRQVDIAELGLCHAMIPTGKDYFMPKKLVYKKTGYWWRRGKKGDEYRAFFAGLMAAMGNRGFASFLKWCEKHS